METLERRDEELRSATQEARRDLAEAIAYSLGERQELIDGPAGLTLVRRTMPTEPCSALYAPSLAVVAQGTKRVVVGTETYVYDESSFLLTAVDLPTVSQVVIATTDTPYVCAMLPIDLAVARELIAELRLEAPGLVPTATGMAIGPATVELIGAMTRLVRLSGTPRDLPILGPLLQREILYRILTSPAGGRLLQAVQLGTHGQRVGRAVAWLRDNYASPLRVEALAEHAHMGVSTLHHHFRLLTAMSPLQYQKHLRLHEARRLMLAEGLDAGTAALQVGYESATQFSREYSRLFGAPPLRDVNALRATGAPILAA